ncbi:MAG TPA: AbrB/MazE/SpoVT family DNA-binding domain-containing protein [Methylomirabilota bacterium]|jgi:antitoxin MazE|nr:AbrB/MazE/SpoVT family DNA-binding domain-containing protein [Methylomirabilota bacterium]
MKTRLVRIGNSREVRLPKPLIEEAGLSDEVEVRLLDGALVITPDRRPRSGWAEAARRVRERREHRLLDEPTPTRFDDQEWQWK